MDRIIQRAKERISKIRLQIYRGEFEKTEEHLNAKQLITDIIEAFEAEYVHFYELQRDNSAKYKVSCVKIIIFAKYLELFATEEKYQKYDGKFHPFFDDDWKTLLGEQGQKCVERVGFNLEGKFVVHLSESLLKTLELQEQQNKRITEICH